MIVFACRNPQILSCVKLNWDFLKSPMLPLFQCFAFDPWKDWGHWPFTTLLHTFSDGVMSVPACSLISESG